MILAVALPPGALPAAVAARRHARLLPLLLPSLVPRRRASGAQGLRSEARQREGERGGRGEESPPGGSHPPQARKERGLQPPAPDAGECLLRPPFIARVVRSPPPPLSPRPGWRAVGQGRKERPAAVPFARGGLGRSQLPASARDKGDRWRPRLALLWAGAAPSWDGLSKGRGGRAEATGRGGGCLCPPLTGHFPLAALGGRTAPLGQAAPPQDSASEERRGEGGMTREGSGRSVSTWAPRGSLSCPRRCQHPVLEGPEGTRDWPQRGEGGRGWGAKGEGESEWRRCPREHPQGAASGPEPPRRQNPPSHRAPAGRLPTSPPASCSHPSLAPGSAAAAHTLASLPWSAWLPTRSLCQQPASCRPLLGPLPFRRTAWEGLEERRSPLPGDAAGGGGWGREGEERRERRSLLRLAPGPWRG